MLSIPISSMDSLTDATVNRNTAAYVRWVQDALNHILAQGLAVDGIYGPLTRSAVRRFQQHASIGVDGIVGPITEAVMVRFGAVYPPGGGESPTYGAPPAFPPQNAEHANLDAGVRYSLRRMSRAAPDARTDAVLLLNSTQEGRLLGVFGEEDPRVMALAATHSSYPQGLIPPGRDAALIPDASLPYRAPPTIVFRSVVRALPERLDAALRSTVRLLRAYLEGRVGPCATEGVDEQLFPGHTVCELPSRPSPPPRAPCGGSSTLEIRQSILDAITETETLAGLNFRRANPLCDATRSCPTPYRPPHARGDATHLVRLGLRQVRVAELSGLFGADVSATRSVRSKAATSVKRFETVLPFGDLSVVGLLRRGRREMHLHVGGDRVVESRVNGRVWKSLPHVVTPGTNYEPFKVNLGEASLHRQWGREECIAWLNGLSHFYRHHTTVRLGIGDVSHILGEAITDHGSHRLGRDVDLYPINFLDGVPLPETYWCHGPHIDLELSALTPPADNTGRYGPPLVTLAQARQDALFTHFATVLAYAYCTWAQINAFVWHGVRHIETDAVRIAEAAVNSGWNPNWGPAPAATGLDPGRTERHRRLIGAGSTSYCASDCGWPLHQNHIHVRLNL